MGYLADLLRCSGVTLPSPTARRPHKQAVTAAATGTSRAWSHKAAETQVWSTHPSAPQLPKDEKCRCGCSGGPGDVGPCGEAASNKQHPRPLDVEGIPLECALVGSGLDGWGDPETLLTGILP